MRSRGSAKTNLEKEPHARGFSVLPAAKIQRSGLSAEWIRGPSGSDWVYPRVKYQDTGAPDVTHKKGRESEIRFTPSSGELADRLRSRVMDDEVALGVDTEPTGQRKSLAVIQSMREALGAAELSVALRPLKAQSSEAIAVPSVPCEEAFSEGVRFKETASGLYAVHARVREAIASSLSTDNVDDAPEQQASPYCRGFHANALLVGANHSETAEIQIPSGLTGDRLALTEPEVAENEARTDGRRRLLLPTGGFAHDDHGYLPTGGFAHDDHGYLFCDHVLALLREVGSSAKDFREPRRTQLPA